MIETSMQLTISSPRDIAVLQKESLSLEAEEDVKRIRTKVLECVICTLARHRRNARCFYMFA